MTRERQARLLIAKGYSCEQAVFGAFADLLGCSVVGAALLAPLRKERGRTCGAYRAGVLLISTLTEPKGNNRLKKRGQKIKEKERLRKDQQRLKAAQMEDWFRALFIGEFGTLDCKAIQSSREKGWAGMDSVVGTTVLLLERVLKERP